MLANILSGLDLYDKTKSEEYAEKTKAGHIVTLATIAISGLTVAWSLIQLFTTDFYRELSTGPVVSDGSDVVNITLSLYVDLPCYYLHIDALDSIGNRQLNVRSTMTLRRLDKSDGLIGISNSSMSDYCGPCYGMRPEEDCCNSCDMLIAIARQIGMPVTPSEWIQCRHGGPTPPRDVSKDEKCLVKGKLTVNKVSGSFHVAVGRNEDRPCGHHHIFSDVPNLEVRHRIDRIRFGPKVPTASSPLVDIVKNLRGGNMVSYTYYLMVTPVTMYVNDRIVATSYEYTSYNVRETMTTPGIFFEYQFSPYSVAVHMRTKNVMTGFASMCGFLAGVFAVCTTLMELVNRGSEGNKPL